MHAPPSKIPRAGAIILGTSILAGYPCNERTTRAPRGAPGPRSRCGNGMEIRGSFDPALVVLSVIIATAASYTALDLAGRVRASAGRARLAWLGTSAVAMGGGIWSMHFIAMLAFVMPMPVAYDIG